MPSANGRAGVWLRVAAAGAIVNLLPAWMAASSRLGITLALVNAALCGIVILLVVERHRVRAR